MQINKLNITIAFEFCRIYLFSKTVIFDYNVDEYLIYTFHKIALFIR